MLRLCKPCEVLRSLGPSIKWSNGQFLVQTWDVGNKKPIFKEGVFNFSWLRVKQPSIFNMMDFLYFSSFGQLWVYQWIQFKHYESTTHSMPMGSTFYSHVHVAVLSFFYFWIPPKKKPIEFVKVECILFLFLPNLDTSEEIEISIYWYKSKNLKEKNEENNSEYFIWEDNVW